MLFPFRQDPVVNSHMFSVAYVHEPFDYDCAAGRFSLRIYMATFAVHHCVQMFSSRLFIGGDDWAMIEGGTLSPAHFSDMSMSHASVTSFHVRVRRCSFTIIQLRVTAANFS